MSEIKVNWLGGNCPVQAEGTVGGKKFYFRARYGHWSLSIGDDPVPSPEWYYEEEYGTEPFDAGWMSEDEVRAFIAKAVGLYEAANKG